MINDDDMTLLQEYARCGSEEAFATLASRHVNLVYSVAMRQVHDAQLAEEITQATFIILAHKAKSLGMKTMLSGWLCRTARYVSADALKIQRRRQLREQEAYMQSNLNKSEPDAWTEIAPLLDPALAQLGEKDHDAIVLRFFGKKNMSEVGLALGSSEDAAKMRVNRALEKLRKFFAKHGAIFSAAAIAGALAANSIQAAPVGLAKSITAVAITKGTAASGSTLVLVKGTMQMMTWLKIKFAMAWGSAIVIAAVGTSAILGSNPTEAQLRQLFDSVARVAPQRMRVISLHTIEETPPSKEEIQRVADATRKIGEREQEGASEPGRSQSIELDVHLRVDTMTGKHYEKIQEWKSGSSYRKDSADGFDKQTFSLPATESTFRQYMAHLAESLAVASLKSNYDATIINLINPTNGTASMREILYGIKSFRTRDGGSLYAEAGAWKGMAVENLVEFRVALALASNESIRKKAVDGRRKMELDETKLKRILSGQDSVFKVSVAERETGGETHLIFDFKSSPGSNSFGASETLIECVKTNLNRITRTEVKNSRGEIQLSSTRSEFDQHDFPHEYLVIEKGTQGYTTNKFSIQEVDLAANFSDDDVFGFEPPTDFGVVADTGGKPVIKSYPDGITPQRTVDVSGIVAELNAKQPVRSPNLVFKIVGIAFVPILILAAWLYFRMSKKLQSR